MEYVNLPSIHSQWKHGKPFRASLGRRFVRGKVVITKKNMEIRNKLLSRIYVTQ